MSENAITERQQYWLKHIRAADRFEGTLVDYAKGEGLKVKDLYQWKTLLARHGVIAAKVDKPNAFVPVQEAASTTRVALALPNGARIELSGGIDAETVKFLVEAASDLG